MKMFSLKIILNTFLVMYSSTQTQLKLKGSKLIKYLSAFFPQKCQICLEKRQIWSHCQRNRRESWMHWGHSPWCTGASRPSGLGARARVERSKRVRGRRTAAFRSQTSRTRWTPRKKIRMTFQVKILETE